MNEFEKSEELIILHVWFLISGSFRSFLNSKVQSEAGKVFTEKGFIKTPTRISIPIVVN